MITALILFLQFRLSTSDKSAVEWILIRMLSDSEARQLVATSATSQGVVLLLSAQSLRNGVILMPEVGKHSVLVPYEIQF